MGLDSFRTPDGAAVTAGEVRAVDRVAVETYGVDVRVVLDWPAADLDRVA
ncbi:MULTISPECIES: hypothetical protein [Haloarcula]|nr:hypothetical protein [Halomicroarcula sp. XH51]